MSTDDAITGTFYIRPSAITNIEPRWGDASEYLVRSPLNVGFVKTADLAPLLFGGAK